MHLETLLHTRSSSRAIRSRWPRLLCYSILLLCIATHCAYVQYRLNLLTDKQNLLFDCLTAPGLKWSRQETRMEMAARGYMLGTVQDPDQDEFYGPDRTATLSIHWIRGWVRYENDIAVAAGVESFMSAF